MVDVGKAGIAAAKLSQKPLTPEAGSRLIAVLAAGKGISTTCKLPSGCQAATAPTPASTRHLLEVSFHEFRFVGKLNLLLPMFCLLSMACIASCSLNTTVTREC